MTDNIPIMLKIKEIPPKFPGVTEHAVRRFIKTGELPSVMSGKKYLIAESVLIDFLIRGNNQTPQTEQAQGKIRVANVNANSHAAHANR